MKKLIAGALAASALVGAAAAANASPLLVRGVDQPGAAVVEKAQYVYYGHDYCWYDGGWRGPGWYWCGYAWNRGYGWGGGPGWRGWYYGPHYWRGGVWVGPRDYHHHEWGGWRGDHDWHGGWHGDHGWHDHDRGWHDHGHWR